MKDRERNILSLLNERVVSNPFDLFIESDDTYSRFDAQSLEYIAEIKYRHSYYPNPLIEFDKYAFNKLYSEIQNKHFLYVIGYPHQIEVYNISTLDKSSYLYNWEWRTMPYYTEFSNNQNISKFVGYLDHSISLTTIKI